RVFSKLLLSFVLVLTVCTAVLDFSIRRIVDRALHEQVEQSLAGEARFLASQLNSAAPESVQKLLADAAFASSARIAVFREDGTFVAYSGPTQMRYSFDALPAIAALRSHEGVGRQVRDGMLFIAARHGGLIVRIGYPLTEIAGKLRL